MRPSKAMMASQQSAGTQATANVLLPLRERTASGSSSESFPQTARLLRHADFRRVYEQGRRHFSTNLTAFYVAQDPPIGARIGFTVSRALGGAVQRNRMKRRLREATRSVWNEFRPSVDIVINPKKTVLSAEFSGLVDEMSKALAVVEKQWSSGQASPRTNQAPPRARKKSR